MHFEFVCQIKRQGRPKERARLGPEHHAHIVDRCKLLPAWLRYPRSDTVTNFDEPIVFQFSERPPYWRATDIELSREFCLTDGVAGAKQICANPVSQVQINLVRLRKIFLLRLTWDVRR